MASLADDAAEAVSSVEITLAVFHAYRQKRMRFHGGIDFGIGLWVGVEGKPCTEKERLAPLHAKLLTEQLHQRNDGLLGVFLLSDTTRMVRSIIQIGLSDTDDQAIEFRKDLKALRNHVTEQFLRAWMARIAPVGSLGLHGCREALWQKDKIRHAEDSDPGRLDSAIEFFQPRRFRVDPGAFVASFWEDRRIEFLPVDRQLRGVKDHKDFRVEPEGLEVSRIVECRDVGCVSRIIVDQIEGAGLAQHQGGEIAHVQQLFFIGGLDVR